MRGLDIIGDPPDLAGRVCEAILCAQYWYYGELHDPANVVYLRFESRWHRLAFDGGVVFCSEQDEAPASWSVEEQGWEYPLVDLATPLGLVGARLRSYEMRPLPSGSCFAVFHFEGGHDLAFVNVNDRTDYFDRRPGGQKASKVGRRTHIDAFVQLKRSEYGGRPAGSVSREYCPYVRLGPLDEMLSVRVSEVRCTPTTGELYPGESAVVRFELMYPGHPGYDSLVAGRAFDLLEGPRIIGSGEILPTGRGPLDLP